MINKMNQLGNIFEYKLFEEGDHSLSTNISERNEMIISWFNRHLKY